MTTKEFIQYASERPELCEKMSDCATPEEVFAIAKGEGLTDDLATFTEVMSTAKAQAEKLNDTDLDKVNATGDWVYIQSLTNVYLQSGKAATI